MSDRLQDIRDEIAVSGTNLENAYADRAWLVTEFDRVSRELAEAKADAVRFRWALEHFDVMTAYYYNCAGDEDLRQQIDAALAKNPRESDADREALARGEIPAHIAAPEVHAQRNAACRFCGRLHLPEDGCPRERNERSSDS